MCRICKVIESRPFPLTDDDTDRSLEEIGAAIAKGASSAHFSELMDRILDMPPPNHNEELDTAWEEGRRS